MGYYKYILASILRVKLVQDDKEENSVCSVKGPWSVACTIFCLLNSGYNPQGLVLPPLPVLSPVLP